MSTEDQSAETPTRASREEIWRSIFPPEATPHQLDPRRLAQLAVSGGTISNVARRAAFLAATESGPVEMRHLRESARSEAQKLGRDLAPEETAGWE